MQAFAATFGLGIFSSPAVVAANLAATGSFQTAYLIVGTVAALTAVFPLWMPSPALRDQPADTPAVATDGSAKTLQSRTGPKFQPLPVEDMVFDVKEPPRIMEEEQRNSQDNQHVDDEVGDDAAAPLKMGGSCSNAKHTGDFENDHSIWGLEAETLVKGLVALIIMCYCGAEASFGAWVPTFAVTTHTLDQVCS